MKKTSVLLLLMAWLVLPASAQEVATSSADLNAPEEAATEDTVEKIPVVGTRIRQIDLEGASPVKVIDREEIEKSAAHTVGGILQNSTLSPYGGSSSRISVRGMGATRTLVLINGRRTPKTGGSYGSRATNINIIPTSAVERIETLTDGASAVYGSEALSSVINIVTRKNVDGVVATLKPGASTIPGSEFVNGSMTWGKTFSRGHVSTSFDVDYSGESFSKDIDYIHPRTLRSVGTSDNYRVYGEMSSNAPFSNCHEIVKGECSQYHGDISRSDGGAKISNYTEFRYDITSGITLTADLEGKYAEGKSYSPAYMRFDLKPVEYHPSWRTEREGWGEHWINFTHRLKGVERWSSAQTYNLGTNLGLSGDWGDGDWMWVVNNNFGGYREKDVYGNMLLIEQSKEVFKSGRYNPFVGENFSAVAGEVLYDATSFTDYYLNVVSGSVDGPLYEGTKANLSVAGGVEWGYHKYREVGDPQASNGNVSGLQGVNSSGSRTHQAVYAELGANYSDWLETQLAARLERYSDFGTTLNPKLAVLFKPWKKLAFRGSVGTGFKAPELSESRGGQGLVGYLGLVDEVECEKRKNLADDDPEKRRFCMGRGYEVQASPNPAIQEETSLSYNAGVVVEPARGMTVKLDYWHYKVEDVIGLPPIQHVLKLQSEGKNPNIESYGIKEIIRDKDGDVDPNIDKIEMLVTANIGTEIHRGLDLEMDYKVNPRTSLWMRYSLKLEDYYELDGKQESSLGDYGVPRYRYSLGWDYTFPGDKHSLRLERETVGRYKNFYEDGMVPEHSQYNAVWNWKMGSGKRDERLVVKANNLFNLRPHYDRRLSTYFDTALYSGAASYSLQYTVTF